jgi:hypothetical protein
MSQLIKLFRSIGIATYVYMHAPNGFSGTLVCVPLTASQCMRISGTSGTRSCPVEDALRAGDPLGVNSVADPEALPGVVSGLALPLLLVVVLLPLLLVVVVEAVGLLWLRLEEATPPDRPRRAISTAL